MHNAALGSHGLKGLPSIFSKQLHSMSVLIQRLPLHLLIILPSSWVLDFIKQCLNNFWKYISVKPCLGGRVMESLYHKRGFKFVTCLWPKQRAWNSSLSVKPTYITRHK